MIELSSVCLNVVLLHCFVTFCAVLNVYTWRDFGVCEKTETGGFRSHEEFKSNIFILRGIEK